jgi:hypothetical protein
MASAVRGDAHVVDELGRNELRRLGRQGGAAIDADPADPRLDHGHLRQPLRTDSRSDAVGADQHVALRARAVIEVDDDPVAAFLIAGHRRSDLEMVFEAGAEDLPQGVAVHSAVRARPIVRSSEVGHRAEDLEVLVEHDGAAAR